MTSTIVCRAKDCTYNSAKDWRDTGTCEFDYLQVNEKKQCEYYHYHKPFPNKAGCLK